MAAAFALPRVLERYSDRPVMLTGAGLMTASLFAAALALSALDGVSGWRAILVFWLALGAGYAAIVTPTGRLLRLSSSDADRPALFAAQFALSHACWLITYPMAGWLGASRAARHNHALCCVDRLRRGACVPAMASARSRNRRTRPLGFACLASACGGTCKARRPCPCVRHRPAPPALACLTDQLRELSGQAKVKTFTAERSSPLRAAG